MKEETFLNHFQQNNIILIQQVSTINKQAIDEIMAYNQKTIAYGLSLTKQQALSLMETRQNVLTKTKRIELKGHLIGQFIDALYDSPFVTKDNYEEILHIFIELFYELKNETWDTIHDQELIHFMKKSFNHECQGSLDILNDELSRLIQFIHHGGTIDDYHSPLEEQ